MYLSQFHFSILGSLEIGRISLPPLGSLLITRTPMGTHNTERILGTCLEAMSLCLFAYPWVVLCP